MPEAPDMCYRSLLEGLKELPAKLQQVLSISVTSMEWHAGLEAALERFADHDVLRAVLDLGSDPKEYGRQYEAQLRSAELESIQDYIAEAAAALVAPDIAAAAALDATPYCQGQHVQKCWEQALSQTLEAAAVAAAGTY